MFHNFFYLKRYAAALDKRIKGLQLKACFSQHKNELILGFASATEDCWIRANMEPQVGLLQVIEDFRRARKNSVTLFEDLLEQKVEKVDCFTYERSFYIHFESGFQLIFKMHASRSNLLLAAKNKVLEVFRNQLPQDLEIIPDQLHQHLKISFERFESVNGKPTPFIPALGKEVKKYLIDLGYESMDLDQKWKLMQNVLNLLETNPISIYLDQGLSKLTLLPVSEETLVVTTDPIEAGNKLYTTFTHSYYLGSEKRTHIKRLEAQIKKTENYLAKSKGKLESIKSRRSYGELANIIMANLNQIRTGKYKVTLFDFYQDQNIDIKLNPELSPQKNAENLYRKSKNEAIELKKVEENISERSRKLVGLREELEEVLASEDFKVLRKKFSKTTQQKDAVTLPYHPYEFQGFQILVGKHAKANDELTLKVANKSDYWLHARSVPGSHVVIRHQAGKTLPKDVLERAAELAAWFSKRKTDSLCPVIHTQKKYVRKAKGSPPGQVIVEREEVLMVKPKGFQDNSST